MNKVLILPDSYKGTLSAVEVARVIGECTRRRFPSAEVIEIPVADGGEGSVACFLQALDGERITCRTRDPLGGEILADWGLLDGGRCAVIEMAAAAGLPLVEGRRDPLNASTYGVGLLLCDALSRGVREVILGLGGSSTTDFGCGAAAALGVRFYDAGGRELIPTGGTLCKVVRVDTSGALPALRDVKLTLMCDVKNPLCGKNGAAYVFSPQKGASDGEVALLDGGLAHIAAVVRQELGVDVADLAGGGAAGGMAAGMVAFFGGTICSGIDTVLSAVGFDGLLAGADLVFTGEGKLDGQSAGGKVISGICARAAAVGVPVVAVCGGIEGDITPLYEGGLTAAFAINRLPEDFSISRHKSAENLRATVEDILRLLSAK